jgi:hypothetical protein
MIELIGKEKKRKEKRSQSEHSCLQVKLFYATTETTNKPINSKTINPRFSCKKKNKKKFD